MNLTEKKFAKEKELIELRHKFRMEELEKEKTLILLKHEKTMEHYRLSRSDRQRERDFNILRNEKRSERYGEHS